MNNAFRISPSAPLRRLTLALALLGLPGAALPGRAQSAAGKEQLVVALSAPGQPGALEVSLVSGSIHVIGYDGKTVVIDATARTRRSSRDEDGGDDDEKVPPNGLKRIAASNSLRLSAEEKNNRVAVSTDSHVRPVDLTIKVPQRFSLNIRTVNQGDIVVDNVTGELEVTNVNGAIQLNQVAGSAVANTVNGNLVATFRSVKAGAPMAFSTLNGKVDVTLPATTSAALKLKSEQGSIFSDFAVAVTRTAPKVTRTAKNGVYRLSTDDWTYGKINSGGPEIMLKSFNGDIYLRKGK